MTREYDLHELGMMQNPPVSLRVLASVTKSQDEMPFLCVCIKDFFDTDPADFVRMRATPRLAFFPFQSATGDSMRTFKYRSTAFARHFRMLKTHTIYISLISHKSGVLCCSLTA